MARTSTNLNFTRQTEEAFNFYKSVFGTEFEGQISRRGDVLGFGLVAPAYSVEA